MTFLPSSSGAHPRGAILIEVLISLLIFTIGMTAALAVLIASVNANSTNKNRIIATNLAREGLEVVKNIRDTNWLISSANLRECWNFSPDTEEDADMTNNVACTPDAAGQNQHPLGTIGIGAGRTRIRSFLADFDPASARWMLLPAPDYLERNEASGDYMTFVPYSLGTPNGEATSVSSVDDRAAQLFVTPDGRYTHAPDGNAPTGFSRTIELFYIDNPGAGQDELFPDGNILPAGEGAWRDNRLKVVATVFWKNNSSAVVLSTVELETILTDYLNRENWID